MKEKIAPLLIILVAVVAFVLLLRTPARTPAETAPPATEETVPETAPAEDALSMVEDILDRHPLDKTALSHSIYDETLHSGEELTGSGKSSPAHALARLSDDRKMNPIAAFWLLTEEGLYRKTPENADRLAVPAVQTPEVEQREYPYTAAGVREFLTELLTLAAQIEDGLPLDLRALGEDAVVETEQVSLEQGECYYTYYVCYSPEAAHFLCFYIRGDETITDAEFQLLNLRYADGEPESLTRLDQLGDRQAAALMTAAEVLLTGESRAADGRIPLGYALEDHTVTIERFSIIGSGDTGTLTNYRIRK